MILHLTEANKRLLAPLERQKAVINLTLFKVNNDDSPNAIIASQGGITMGTPSIIFIVPLRSACTQLSDYKSEIHSETLGTLV